MLREIDTYFVQQNDPVKSCLQALRGYILQFDENITEVWRHNMPFYNYNGKRFCYIWLHKKKAQPYIGLVDGKSIIHPTLIAEKRSRMKILLIDPNEDLPLNTINLILLMAINLVEKNI